jgi:hypothetical protein
MSRVTEELVRSELAGLDDLEVASVVALGATEAEVLEARAWVEGDEEVVRSLEAPGRRRSGRRMLRTGERRAAPDSEARAAGSACDAMGHASARRITCGALICSQAWTVCTMGDRRISLESAASRSAVPTSLEPRLLASIPNA